MSDPMTPPSPEPNEGLIAAGTNDLEPGEAIDKTELPKAKPMPFVARAQPVQIAPGMWALPPIKSNKPPQR